MNILKSRKHDRDSTFDEHIISKKPKIPEFTDSNNVIVISDDSDVSDDSNSGLLNNSKNRKRNRDSASEDHISKKSRIAEFTDSNDFIVISDDSDSGLLNNSKNRKRNRNSANEDHISKKSRIAEFTDSNDVVIISDNSDINDDSNNGLLNNSKNLKRNRDSISEDHISKKSRIVEPTESDDIFVMSDDSSNSPLQSPNNRKHSRSDSESEAHVTFKKSRVVKPTGSNNEWGISLNEDNNSIQARKIPTFFGRRKKLESAENPGFQFRDIKPLKRTNIPEEIIKKSARANIGSTNKVEAGIRSVTSSSLDQRSKYLLQDLNKVMAILKAWTDFPDQTDGAFYKFPENLEEDLIQHLTTRLIDLRVWLREV